MKPLKLWYILVLSFVNSVSVQNLHSEEPNSNSEETEIVISANNSEQARKEVASSVTIIDQAKIIKEQDNSIVDVLSKQPTLDVVSSGTKGASTTVSIRGANPEHTLVLLDGIELNNPILPSRSFNFADLALNEVERIEILRGPQSTIYGSDALGGVINIISKKPVEPFSAKASLEAGSFSSYREKASFSGKEEILNYGFSFFREDLAGISSAEARDGNSENDKYDNSTYFTRFGLTPSDHTEFNTIFRAVDSASELDNFGGLAGDDLNREQTNDQYFWGNSLKSNFLDDKLQSNITYSYSDQTFNDDNDPDNISFDTLRSKYEGKLSKVGADLSYLAAESTTINFGLTTEEETGEANFSSSGPYGDFADTFNEVSSHSNGYYLNSTLGILEKFVLGLGIRVDDGTEFGSEVTYRIAPVLLFNESGTRIFSTVGTGFKAPSLFQLYSIYGSQDLQAEESFAVDFGVEQVIIPDAVNLTITYFDQDFDNLINFDPQTFLFSNIDSAESSGLESALSFAICEYAKLELAYTYLDASDEDTGQSLLRRAKNKFASSLSMAPTEKLEVLVQTSYKGSRFDNDFSTLEPSRAELSAYSITDLLFNYKLDQNLDLFARVENIFDNNYTEVLGYGTYGVGAYAGVRYSY